MLKIFNYNRFPGLIPASTHNVVKITNTEVKPLILPIWPTK